MPRKPIDYSNTHFYKIVCKDTNMKDCYVGHTTDFTKRKYNHKKSCLNPNDKIQLYVHEFIRLNGNWDNWDMIEIETRCCENSLEARRIEREHIEYLNATLNKRSPYISEEEASNFRQVYMKEYKKNNKEQLDNYNKTYREERRELINEKAKQHYRNKIEGNNQYREENREKIHQRNKTYYENNKAKITEKDKKTDSSDP